MTAGKVAPAVRLGRFGPRPRPLHVRVEARRIVGDARAARASCQNKHALASILTELPGSHDVQRETR